MAVVGIPPRASLSTSSPGAGGGGGGQPAMKQPTSSSSSSERLRRDGRRGLRHAFPEFLPDPNPLHRNKLREMLERQDMLRRRRQIEVPEFYVGSVLAVTASDPNSAAEGKLMRFVGVVIDRGGTGLRAWTVVRNVIDGQVRRAFLRCSFQYVLSRRYESIETAAFNRKKFPGPRRVSR